MSLNYDLRGIKDHDTLCFISDEAGERRLNPITEGVIFLTMACDLGWGVTPENVEEFVARAEVWQTLMGAMLMDDKGPRPVTGDEIRAHVGLNTNVAYMKRSKWLGKVWRAKYPELRKEAA